MKKLQLPWRSKVDAPTNGLKGILLRNIGVVTRSRRLVAAIAFVGVISSFSLPASAPADIDDIVAAIEQVFNDAIEGLQGNEFEPQKIQFEYTPPGFPTVRVDVTVLGFAFCDPPNPWVVPDPTPTFPFNVYGCENVATVTANVSPDVTSSDILIEVSDFFLDIEYERDETPACLECCPGCPWPFDDPCTTVPGEGYLLTSGSIAATLTLTRVGTCLHASIVPGSVVVTLVPKDRGFRITPSLANDTCVDGAWDLFSPLFFDMLNQTAGEGLEAILVDQTTAINQVLCPLTPVEESTWGHIKALFD